MPWRIKYESHGKVAKNATRTRTRILHRSNRVRSGFMTTVRTPASGIVYVMCLVAFVSHRDQSDEPGQLTRAHIRRPLQGKPASRGRWMNLY